MIIDEDPAIFTKFYCSCGRFVDLDSNYLSLRKTLNKCVECSVCRNARISEELSFLDEHYTFVGEPVCE